MATQLSGTLVALLLIYIYLTVNPENQTGPIFVSRLFWIGFGISRLSNLIIQIMIFNYGWLAKDVLTTFDILNRSEFISVSAIIIILIFYPETLLIGKYQIANAHNLYAMVKNPKKLKLNAGIPLISTTHSLFDYLSSLPAELIKEKR